MALPVVTAPADKRFRRAHVTPTRRRVRTRPSKKRTTVIALAVVTGLLVTYAGIRAVLSSSALAVTTITIAGNSRLSDGEVLSLLDGLEGSNMLSIGLDTWRQKLLASPWVADAAIRRVFPGTIDVAISEQHPMGIARIGGRLYLIDPTGSIIDEFGPNYQEIDLPVIDGLASAPRSGGPLIDPARAALATRVLSSLQARPDLADRVSEIDVSDVRNAAVILKGDTALVRIGEDDFAERLQSYLDLAPTLRERVPEIDYVDLRYGERIYVRRQESRSRSGRTNGD